jgi:hypothetical protein
MTSKGRARPENGLKGAAWMHREAHEGAVCECDNGIRDTRPSPSRHLRSASVHISLGPRSHLSFGNKTIVQQTRGPISFSYSPDCVELEFSEVHFHDPV